MLGIFITIVTLLFLTTNNETSAPMDMHSRQFEILLADALEHLWDFSYLGKHPLSQLSIVRRRLSQKADESHLDVGRALSEVLRAAIVALKPTEDQETCSREKHYYAILTKAYVEGITNRAIAKSIDVGDRTLYRYSIKAIQCVARIVLDWEAHLSDS